MVSRIKERLLQYKQELQKQTMYKEGLPGSSLDIVNSLLDDLEEDEKENGWIPVTERLPEEDGAYIVTFKNGIRVRMALQKNGAGISNRSWLVQFGNSTILCR